MSELNAWLKPIMFKELETILNQTIDQMLHDAFIKHSQSSTINNFYQEVQQDYIQFYIKHITHKLHSHVSQLAKSTSTLLLDSRKCPKHLKPDAFFYKTPTQLNTSLLDIAKQSNLLRSFQSFTSPHRLIFLDIETDSLQTNVAHILQISLLELQCTQNPLNPVIIKPVCNSFIKPYDGYIINTNDKSSRIHNITQEQIDNAPYFHTVASDIVDLTVLSTLVGFNIEHFDLPILLRHLQACHEEPGWTHTIDVAQAYWKYFPATLENALRMLDIQHKPLHHAENDAIACIDLLSKLIDLGKLPSSPIGFQKLLNNPDENTTRYGKTIIQRNTCPTHPWVGKDWTKHYDVEILDASQSSNKRPRSPVITDSRVPKKHKL